MTAEKIIKEGVDVYHYPAFVNTARYFYHGKYYIVQDNKILCWGSGVIIYSNGDYIYVDEDNCNVLMRDGKILYKTGPGKQIISGKFRDPKNIRYLVKNVKSWVTIKELNFPFNTGSILDVIDNKLKGELC